MMVLDLHRIMRMGKRGPPCLYRLSHFVNTFEPKEKIKKIKKITHLVISGG